MQFMLCSSWQKILSKIGLQFSSKLKTESKGLFTENKKEGNVLVNDTLNTFYLRLYGIRHMVKDHSDSKREETRCCHYMGSSF